MQTTISDTQTISLAITGLPHTGKTSTINRLFKQAYQTDTCEPTTMTVERHRLQTRIREDSQHQWQVTEISGLVSRPTAAHCAQLSAHVRDQDVILWLVNEMFSDLDDDTTGRPCADRLYLDMLHQLGKPIIVGINKIDLAAPYNWSNYYCIPSREQHITIEEDTKLYRERLNDHYSPAPSVVAYSSRHFIGLTELLMTLIRAVPDAKAWQFDALNDGQMDMWIANYIYSL